MEIPDSLIIYDHTPLIQCLQSLKTQCGHHEERVDQIAKLLQDLGVQVKDLQEHQATSPVPSPSAESTADDLGNKEIEIAKRNSVSESTPRIPSEPIVVDNSQNDAKIASLEEALNDALVRLEALEVAKTSQNEASPITPAKASPLPSPKMLANASEEEHSVPAIEIQREILDGDAIKALINEEIDRRINEIFSKQPAVVEPKSKEPSSVSTPVSSSALGSATVEAPTSPAATSETSEAFDKMQQMLQIQSTRIDELTERVKELEERPITQAEPAELAIAVIPRANEEKPEIDTHQIAQTQVFTSPNSKRSLDDALAAVRAELAAIGNKVDMHKDLIDQLQQDGVAVRSSLDQESKSQRDANESLTRELNNVRSAVENSKDQLDGQQSILDELKANLALALKAAKDAEATATKAQLSAAKTQNNLQDHLAWHQSGRSEDAINPITNETQPSNQEPIPVVNSSETSNVENEVLSALVDSLRKVEERVQALGASVNQKADVDEVSSIKSSQNATNNRVSDLESRFAALSSRLAAENIRGGLKAANEKQNANANNNSSGNSAEMQSCIDDLYQKNRQVKADIIDLTSQFKTWRLKIEQSLNALANAHENINNEPKQLIERIETELRMLINGTAQDARGYTDNAYENLRAALENTQRGIDSNMRNELRKLEREMVNLVNDIPQAAEGSAGKVHYRCVTCDNPLNHITGPASRSLIRNIGQSSTPTIYEGSNLAALTQQATHVFAIAKGKEVHLSGRDGQIYRGRDSGQGTGALIVNDASSPRKMKSTLASSPALSPTQKQAQWTVAYVDKLPAVPAASRGSSRPASARQFEEKTL